MRRLLLFAFLFFLNPFGVSATLLIKTAESGLGKRSDGQSATGIAVVDQVLRAHGAVSVKSALAPLVQMIPESAELSRWFLCEFSDQNALAAAQQALQASGAVVEAQPNRAFRSDFSPDDPLFEQQYALKKISAPQAWDIERGSPEVLVAVIDTGIDYNHPDLLANLWRNDRETPNGLDDDGNGFVDDLLGWDFTDAPNYPDGGDFLQRDNDPMDEHGHGTAVAGIIAATTDNGLGIAGLAHGCRVMNLRAFTSSGYGEEDDVASALLYAVDNGAQVVNMSFGDIFVSRILEDVVRYAYARGLVMVASAGNSATDAVHYPSGFAETISVGASDENDRLSSFSNFGATVDLVAPGSAVLSAALKSDYQRWNGTSFSAPFVSGAAALVRSQRPGLTADAVRAVLVNSADDLGDAGWDDRFGAGRLDVLRALTISDQTVAQILSPALDAGFSDGPVAIIGSAWSPQFDGYRLYYGEGANPKSWTPIGEVQRTPVIEGALGLWQNLPTQGEYTLRLEVTDKKQARTFDQTRIFIDRTPPQISNLQLLPMLDGDRHSILVQFESDDLCEGSLFFRRPGEPFSEIPLSFRTHTLRYNLNQSAAEGELELYVQARNGAGLSTIDDDNGRFYRVDLSQPPIDVTRFVAQPLSVPFGRLLPTAADFNNNGLSELITSIRENGAIGPMKLYEFDGSTLREVFGTDAARIPRDLGDSDGNGRMEVLCGLGLGSFLYESPAVGDFPSQLKAAWQGDGSTQYWASRLADLDRDGRGEVIMRVVQPQGPTDQFEIWELDAGEYVKIADLPNFTKGENFNGVPRCEIGDFDGDGRLEILLGDSDGDLYIYENRGDNQFTPTWQDRLPLLDSIDFIAAGDFDGDGRREFVAGCHSDANLNTEHDYDARHWLYRVYRCVGDGRFEAAFEQRIFGYESPRDFLSSVSTGDIDGDGRDEIFIVAYPDFYLFEYEAGEFRATYHQADVQSSAALVTDADADGRRELWLGDGETLRALTLIGGGTAPAAPAGLVARPLDQRTVRLNWRAVDGADEYRIARGLQRDALSYLSSTTAAFFEDLNVETDSLYFYAVQTLDRQKEPQESLPSRIVSARPGLRPALLRAEAETRSTVRLSFSKPMGESAKIAAHYEVAGVRPTSAAVAGGSDLLLTFPMPFEAGEYRITCRGLNDRNGVPLDTTRSSLTFTVRPSAPHPYLLSADWTADRRIRLTFSEKMAASTAADSSRYEVNGVKVKNAEPVGEDRVLLMLHKDAASGDTLRIVVRGLAAANGRDIRPGRGDSIVLVVPAVTDVSEGVIVFPNPFVGSEGVTSVTFRGLRQTDELTVMTSEGQRVKRLSGCNDDGELQWDMTNDRGERVASGVYLFHVRGQFGKLAVVR